MRLLRMVAGLSCHALIVISFSVHLVMRISDASCLRRATVISATRKASGSPIGARPIKVTVIPGKMPMARMRRPSAPRERICMILACSPCFKVVNDMSRWLCICHSRFQLLWHDALFRVALDMTFRDAPGEKELPAPYYSAAGERCVSMEECVGTTYAKSILFFSGDVKKKKFVFIIIYILMDRITERQASHSAVSVK